MRLATWRAGAGLRLEPPGASGHKIPNGAAERNEDHSCSSEDLTQPQGTGRRDCSRWRKPCGTFALSSGSHTHRCGGFRRSHHRGRLHHVQSRIITQMRLNCASCRLLGLGGGGGDEGVAWNSAGPALASSGAYIRSRSPGDAGRPPGPPEFVCQIISGPRPRSLLVCASRSSLTCWRARS